MDDSRKLGVGRLQTIMEEGQTATARMDRHNSSSNKGTDGTGPKTTPPHPHHYHPRHHHSSTVPSLCIQPGTPISSSSSPSSSSAFNTPHPAGDSGEGLPALSNCRSLINGGRPTPSPQPSPRLSHRGDGLEPKALYANGGSQGGKGLHVGLGGAASGFQKLKTDVNCRGYGPQVTPLSPRKPNNSGPLSSNGQGQNYGHSPKQVPPAKKYNSPNNLVLHSSNMAAMSGAGNSGSEPGLYLPLQTLQTHTPTPSEVSDITARSLHTPRDTLHTPRDTLHTPRDTLHTPRDTLHTPPSLVGERDPATLATPGMYSNGGVKATGAGAEHVFLEPLPKNGDWPYFKRLPSLPSNSNDSIGSEVDHSLHLAGSGSGGGFSHNPGSSNLSNHALEFSPFASRFTTPRHSANGHARTSQKRALSISPSLSEGVDLSQLIRMSPTSLAFLNNAHGSLTPVSPQMGHQGAFSHMVRNSSPHFHYGGQPGHVSLGGKNPADNFGFAGPLETDGGHMCQFMASNACVARQSDMPFIENSYIQGGWVPAMSQPNAMPPSVMETSHMPQLTFPSQSPLVGGGVQHPGQGRSPSVNGMTTAMQTSPPYPEIQASPGMGGPPPPPHQPAPFLSPLDGEGRGEESMEEEGGGGSVSCLWMECGHKLREQEELVRHIEKAHIDQRKGDDFTCYWAGCSRQGRPFNARYKLLIHMRVHSGEKPNKCTYENCNKAFSRLENLKIHLRSHTGERPYLCQHQGCHKSFSNSSDRAKHQRTHQDTKPYACSVPGCNKRYTDPSSLRKHFKNHGRDQQTNKRLKKEGEVWMGGDILSDCLTVQQLHPEGSPMDQCDNSMGPLPVNFTDIYSGVNFSTSHSSAAPGGSGVTSQPSAGAGQQSSPITNTLNNDNDTSHSMGGYSPGPANMLSPRPLPPIRRSLGSVAGVQGAYAHTGYPMGHHLNSNMMAGGTPAYGRQMIPGAGGGGYAGASSCRMGAMQASPLYASTHPHLLPEQFMTEGGQPPGTFPQQGFDPSLPPSLEGLHGMVPEQQFLQLTAVDAHNNPAPAVYADGSS